MVAVTDTVFPRLLTATAALLVCAGLVACSSVPNVGQIVTPYKAEIVQGTVVAREQVQALQPGMPRQQVRDILGSPSVTSLFHDSRWEYVFLLKRQGTEPVRYRIAVHFTGDAFVRWEGDTLPTEAELVAQLGSGQKPAKVPTLEATAEQLERARGPSQPAQPAPPATRPAASYPPLETPAR